MAQNHYSLYKNKSVFWATLKLTKLSTLDRGSVIWCGLRCGRDSFEAASKRGIWWLPCRERQAVKIRERFDEWGGLLAEYVCLVFFSRFMRSHRENLRIRNLTRQKETYVFPFSRFMRSHRENLRIRNLTRQKETYMFPFGV